MSRRTKTLLRKTQSLLLPKTINLESKKKGLQQRQQAQARYYNRSAKDRSSLSQGNVVRMKPSNLGVRPKSPQGLTSDHTPLRRTAEQSTAEIDSICEKRLNHPLNPSPQSENRIGPVEMKRRLQPQYLPLIRAVPLISHTLKW